MQEDEAPGAKFTQLLLQTLRTSRRVKTYAEAMMILHEVYDMAYGIHDHLAQARIEEALGEATKKRPLSSVALHDAEDFCTDSATYEFLDMYEANNIFQLTGISLQEFSMLPHDITERILRRCGARVRAQAAQNAAALAGLPKLD